jgi:hypothetical protein
MRIELGDADVAYGVALDAPSNRPHLDDFSRQLQLDRLVLTLARQGYANGAIDGPRIFSTACCKVRPLIGSPSIAVIRSFARTPARAAGV